MTTEPEPGPPRLPLWRYLVKWAGEESFWREMTTRTLSALLAAAVIFLGARSGGLFQEVPWSTVGTTLAASGAWGFGISAVIMVLAALLWRANKDNRARKSLLRIFNDAREEMEGGKAKHEKRLRDIEQAERDEDRPNDHRQGGNNPQSPGMCMRRSAVAPAQRLCAPCREALEARSGGASRRRPCDRATAAHGGRNGPLRAR